LRLLLLAAGRSCGYGHLRLPAADPLHGPSHHQFVPSRVEPELQRAPKAEPLVALAEMLLVVP
jgi:hypothetical protein